jgi:hydrogenase maturation protease
VSERRHPLLVLALGNDVMGDDGAGPAAARALRERYGDRVDVVESGEAGLALLEILEGYERALLLDTILTGTVAAGTILCFRPDSFRKVVAPSPHYAGLPEVFELARRLDVPLPREIEVLAMEAKDPYTVREGLTPEVAAALPSLVERASAILDRWLDDDVPSRA